MAIAMPAGTAAALKQQGGRSQIVTLVDIQTRDGSLFYYTDYAGVYPKVLGAAGSIAYVDRVKSAGPLRYSRSLRTDGGDLVLDNVGGNTIDRYTATELKGREFEGAICVLRLWLMPLDAVIHEFHGTLTDQESDEEQATFRLRQLIDGGEYDVPTDTVSEGCTWRYKSAQCGSVNAAATCNKTFADCTVRGATERFNGVPMPQPLISIGGVLNNRGGGRDGGGGGRGGPIDRIRMPSIK
jgi:hypothetical protein